MKPEVLPSKQITETQIISLITLILLLISFLWLFYKIYAYSEISESESISSFDSIYTGIAIGNFLKFILLIFFGILLYRALKNNVRINALAYFAFVTGFFTILCMFSDWAALHDIFQGEPDTSNEWSFLKMGLIINFIFYIIGFITIIKIRREVRTSLTKRKSVIDETVFEVIQYIGIVCSSIGLGFILFVCLVLSHNHHVISRSDIVIMNLFCLVIFLPYIFIILYWIIKLIREESPEPYDEKQKHDLAMAGLITWLLSIPIVMIYFLIDNGRMGEISKMVYLPLYLFATLLMFSISVLRNFKKL
jgi:heme/copper-type cytochrome/quinol oxidase subunit 2